MPRCGAREADSVTPTATANHTRAFRIWVPLLSALLLLLLLEGGARLALQLWPAPSAGARFAASEVWPHEEHSLHEADAELFWRPIAGRHWRGFQINAQGFRGPPIRLPKPEGVRHWVCVGNSVTFGWGVSEQEAFVGRLRRAAPDDVAVINAGVIGYSSWQGRLFCERRLADLEPDRLLVMFGYNDHHSARLSDRESYARRHLRGLLGWVRESGLFRLVQRIRGRDAPRLRKAPVPRVSLGAYRENLRAIRDAARRAGARAVFLTVPLRPDRPLIENFVPIDFADGRVWMRQIDFAVGSLPPRLGAAVERHFFRGGDLSVLSSGSDACERIDALAGRHPRLPIFPYLQSICLQAAGEDSAASAARRRSRALDGERRELEAYNAVLRDLAAAGEIALIDLAARMAALPPEGLWLDVVHPTPRGHAVIAELVRAGIESGLQKTT
ncbi:MAG: hypothetical protein GF330_11005 [Candidatus Eisenbacteria bacterium]|nr:hypothetical protein [Candidatus Eisenbacteria bacterium]